MIGRVAVAGLLLALFLAIFRSGMIERYFIYFPARELEGAPSHWGLAFEDVFLTASDGVRIHGWFVPGRRDVTWLWFHGNAGNISHRLENLRLLHDELGVSVFIFDYRGYGRSQGSPSEHGTYLDADAALTHLRSRPDVAQDRIIYFGRSLGAAVAVELATRHPPLALILESPFPSVPYMARRTYPFLPVWPLLRTRYDALAKIGNVQAPLLVLHGDRDTIVPIEAGKRLFDAAREPKDLYPIRGAGHNDTYVVGGQDYFTALARFVDGVIR
ncbi:MAG: alpha/beta hydrolase [Chloroflexota bacterium]|nr:alpha/beta hydrolase [Chloroflexota bacterium]